MGLRFRPDGVLGGHLGSQGGQGASNLVRGSPKGAPKGCQSESKSDQIELRNRESYGLGATKRKMYIEVVFLRFFHRFLVRNLWNLINMYNALKPDAAREAQQKVGYLIDDDDRWTTRFEERSEGRQIMKNGPKMDKKWSKIKKSEVSEPEKTRSEKRKDFFAPKSHAGVCDCLRELVGSALQIPPGRLRQAT